MPAARDLSTVAAGLDAVQWIRVSGGRAPAGEWHPAQDVPDLWWASAPLAEDGLPVTGLPPVAAAQLAALLGGRLPTSAEWEWMAGRGRRRFPWGDEPPEPGSANLRDFGPSCATPVTAHPAGRTAEGLWDVAGNVWEWTTAPWRRDRIALLRGGSYNSLIQYASCAHTNDVPGHLSSPGIGLRPVRHGVVETCSPHRRAAPARVTPAAPVAPVAPVAPAGNSCRAARIAFEETNEQFCDHRHSPAAGDGSTLRGRA
ncbi:formylglycine-generating enzyme family protein [Streptomyces alfalfae]